jgi:N-formylglutamate deformylase
MNSTLFDLHQGTVPLLISIPHLGTRLPAEISAAFSPEAAIVSDTDWHLDRLYGFARAMGASVLGATISRYAIDLNRPPGGESLYPGQTTTELCPTETFKGMPLYLPGHAPDQEEVARRRASYWQPYHDALRGELERLRSLHGQVLLWEAHSIASLLPRLFEGKLPDLNFGTNAGATCAPNIIDAVLAPLTQSAAPAPLSHVVNGRFKGGYITRHYAQPEQGIHAIQLEMCQSLYMNEELPFDYRPDIAEKVQPLLQSMLQSGLRQLQTRH